MVLWTDRGAVSYSQMGGEGAQWLGRAPFTDVPHWVQNVGDGTFFHSGSLAVRAAVSAGVSITFKLLYNGTVAMTGGQDPAGQQSVRAGRGRDGRRGRGPLDRRDRRSGALPRPTWQGSRARWRSGIAPGCRMPSASWRRPAGVTLLIYDQGCAAELRRKRKRGTAPVRPRRVVINEAVCEGCGDCGVKSSCLSVHPVDTELGRKTQIHQSSCNTDYSCLEGDCPSFVTVEASSEPAARARPDDVEVPEPPVRASVEPGRPYAIVAAGIGGTGVVTLNQVLGTAAFFEGLVVTALDQTGLSQKGGPVVSHLLLSAEPHAGANSVSPQAADLFLALDPVVAVDPRYLRQGVAGADVDGGVFLAGADHLDGRGRCGAGRCPVAARRTGCRGRGPDTSRPSTPLRCPRRCSETASGRTWSHSVRPTRRATCRSPPSRWRPRSG